MRSVPHQVGAVVAPDGAARRLGRVGGAEFVAYFFHGVLALVKKGEAHAFTGSGGVDAVGKIIGVEACHVPDDTAQFALAFPLR